ncbi:MAG: threonylcarbamoyl-AMP synthase [Rhizobiales bacterium]|nr:threonylcarbamoyl-AMP synthase [Hyphomicrobiales bacterium]|tara:strand:+ start:638 stop:1612 length:975 start_codon:yes stop_codon:yes gene_type:complete
MGAEILAIAENETAALGRALAELSAGRPIGLPTETVYGLAGDATDPAAITRIYEAKSRPRFNPLIAHVADIGMAERQVRFNPLARLLAEKFWPGALTLVLPLAPYRTVHDLGTAGLDTLAVRSPRGFSGRLISAFGKPLAAPSANLSGRISATTAEHVNADLGERINLILDAGPTQVGVESTILKVEDDRLTLLRPGGIATSEIEKVAGRSVARPESDGRIEAPGMLTSHYAPEARVILDARTCEPGDAVVRFGGRAIAGDDEAAIVLDLSPSGDLVEAAANLFATLKKADASGAKTIRIAPVPEHDLGEAIVDRLRRAAAPRG